MEDNQIAHCLKEIFLIKHKINYKELLIYKRRRTVFKNVIRTLNDVLGLGKVSKKGQAWKESLPAQGCSSDLIKEGVVESTG